MTKGWPPAGKVAAGRAIMTGVCRRHKVQLRKRLGTLFSSRIAATTTSFVSLYGALANYIEMLWEEGEPKNHSSDGIAAVQFSSHRPKGT